MEVKNDNHTINKSIHVFELLLISILITSFIISVKLLEHESKRLNIGIPSINAYIQSMGKEKVEEMFLAYLEIKAKFHNSPEEEKSEPLYKQFGISEELHNKLLALKPVSSKNPTKMSLLRDELSHKLKDKYTDKSIEEIRDEYFESKGYL